MSGGPPSEAVTPQAAPHPGLAGVLAAAGRGIHRFGLGARRAWAATSLRLRLVVALLALVAVGLAVTGTVGANLLRRYLVQQVDARVEQAAREGPRPPFAGGNLNLPSSVVYRFYDASGNVSRAVGVGLGGQRVPTLQGITPDAVQKRGGAPFTVSGPNGGRWRTVLGLVVDPDTGSPSGSFAVMASLNDVDRTLNHLVFIELLVGLGVLVLLGVVGVLLVRLSLRPLTDIEHTAEAIGAGDLSRRVPDADPRTEVGRLSVSLNAMLSQIESSARARERSEQEARSSEEQMRQFVADAGHELRTPLTSIRGFAELYRQQLVRAASEAMPEPTETRRMMSRIESEANRMSGLVEDLLLLARLDQQRPLDRRPVDLVPLVADAAFDAHTLAPDRTVRLDLPGAHEQAGANGETPVGGGVPVTAPTPPEAGDAVDGASNPVVVDGDEARLRQILGNLVANALTHTPEGTPVEIGLRTERRDGHDWAVLAVRDEGPGLTEEQATRVFQRFYRADSGRSRNRGGVGLGLSIVAALAHAHGGRVEVDSHPGTGSTFRVLLPVAPGTPVPPPPPAWAPAPS